MTKHTLEQMAAQLPGKLEDQDEKMNAAMFLAFYKAAQNVVGRGVLSTPLIGVSYDSASHHLELEDFEGIAMDFDDDQYVITTFDMIFACHARDMPLIFEGDTGVGKTKTTEAYLDTILPAEEGKKHEP